MDLVERFEDANDKEWVVVNVLLPLNASRHLIKGELGFMAEDLLTQIGYEESESGLKLGFRDEAIRDHILTLLDSVIEEATQISNERASAIRWARSMSRAGISLEANGKMEPHSYAETIDPACN